MSPASRPPRRTPGKAFPRPARPRRADAPQPSQAPPAEPIAPARERFLPGKIRIVHEDEHVIVVDKPAGMLTARGAGVGPKAGSVFDALKQYAKENARRRGARVWIIHRLDKEASGLLVFAKSDLAFDSLKAQFRDKCASRLYAAVVEGEISPGDAGEPERTVRTLLVEGPDGVVRCEPEPEGAAVTPEEEGEFTPEAGEVVGAGVGITHYKPQQRGLGRTLIQARLETGRKNQIRAHMRHLGHSIVGDWRYGAREQPGQRLCLHAYELGFSHPASGKPMRFRSPTPAEFFRLVGRARREEPVPGEAPAGAQGWEHVAPWYDALLEERRSDHHDRVIIPGTLRLLGAVSGGRVLDVACGQGILGRALAGLGAQVVGVDASPRLVEAAARASSPRERYLVGDARELGRLDLGRFDAAACVMALMNIDPLEPVFRGVARGLCEGGIFVAVVLHPAFRAPGRTSWGWSEGREHQGAQYRRVDAYLSSARHEVVMNPGEVAQGKPAISTTTHHRPIGELVRLLASSGLVVDAMEEWASARTSQAGPRADEENRARGEIPMFLAVRARRVWVEGSAPGAAGGQEGSRSDGGGRPRGGPRGGAREIPRGGPRGGQRGGPGGAGGARGDGRGPKGGPRGGPRGGNRGVRGGPRGAKRG